MKSIVLVFLALIVSSCAYASTYEITTPGNNLGIGSTNPIQALDVNGTVRATAFQSGSGSATILGSGTNIGINSSNPTYTLDVLGTVRATSFVGVASSQWTTINTNDVYLPNTGNVGIGTSLTTGAQQTVQKNGSVDYIHVDSTTGAGGNVFLVQNSGNIGIGSTTPGQVLDVNGAIRSISSGVSSFTGGNVGIGTSSAAYNLTIFGNVGIGTSNAAIAQGVTGSGATSCLCKAFVQGICTSLGTCS